MSPFKASFVSAAFHPWQAKIAILSTLGQQLLRAPTARWSIHHFIDSDNNLPEKKNLQFLPTAVKLRKYM